MGCVDSKANFEDGWKQVHAGLSLILWSRLASWNTQKLALVEAQEEIFESLAGHLEVHKRFGRLICWICFSTGSEYLAKGICLLNNIDIQDKSQKRRGNIRPPFYEEDIHDWITLVLADAESVKDKPAQQFLTLGKLPLKQLGETAEEKALISASFKLLSGSIRNRDAHCYAQDVRAFHFNAIERLFVPALNILLRSLDKSKLSELKTTFALS